MMSIAANIAKIKQELSQNVKLIAVSKTKPVESLLEAYQAGQKAFGENKVTEMVSKYEQLPKDIEWHMIGHLQSNKVKYIAPFVYLIHSIDSESLLIEVNKQALKNNRIQKVLLQVSIDNEEKKFGFSKETLFAILEKYNSKTFANTEIIGLMGMASFTDDSAQIADEFESLTNIFNEAKSVFLKNENSFTEISMGMSGDYKIAIEKGSTMIRLGSSIFGSR
jgi:pyridoxal phosphate enzyme (YggS family)